VKPIERLGQSTIKIVADVGFSRLPELNPIFRFGFRPSQLTRMN
jgi:hypothetical protein